MKFHEKEVIEVIRSDDPGAQPILIKAKNLGKPKFEGQFDFLFEDREDTQRLTRNDVQLEMAKNTRKGVLKAFAWGFPEGGRGNLGVNVLGNLAGLSDCLDEMKETGLSERSWEAINGFHGIKFATTTKFLHFAKITSASGPCQIFDERVWNFLEKVQPDEFSATLEKLSRKRSYGIRYATYLTYLNDLNALADKLRVSGAAVEMYMFKNSPDKRAARHQ
ncbi:hypothetical protein Ga0102493_11359 [Erythrobacter litoralis]|uniref:8-oxoguanine DNA glycosylase OGG fold protein n=1 Tax=Erythrobacter litoralis TaxID=39960 RepID=UPI000863A91A|nr:hypothetical protein [Erythrobacter litoralis]AOL24500.1 hypothetical protein Ga0102493_11359 [Erythrobacter litoralis]